MSKLLALGVVLQSEGLGLLRFLVYHDCQNDVTQIRDWSKGYAEPQERCPACHSYYEDNASYDVELIIKYPIQWK